jgi:hypothetical protein
MLRDGIIFEWSKYDKNISKLREIRQAIIISTMSNQYHAKSMWKFITFHMDVGKLIHAHTWNHF